MNLESIEISYLWAVVGGVAYFAIGWAWYSPLLFVDRWLAAQGRTVEQTQGEQPNPVLLGLNLAGSIVMVMIVASVYHWAGGDGLVDGIAAALVVSVGVVAMEAFKGIAYYNHSWTLYAINTGYAVVGLGVAGALYGALA